MALRTIEAPDRASAVRLLVQRGIAPQLIERLDLSGYDVVICDLRMPKIDGPMFFRKVTDEATCYKAFRRDLLERLRVAVEEVEAADRQHGAGHQTSVSSPR